MFNFNSDNETENKFHSVKDIKSTVANKTDHAIDIRDE
jgi:hypothetical protein